MRPSLDFFVRNWTLKLTALALAVLLWSVVKSEAPVRVPIPNVPIEVEIRDQGWTLAAPPTPAAVTVVFTGPVRELIRLAGERPRIIVPVEQVGDTSELRLLEPRWVALETSLDRTRAEDVRPSTVRLLFEQVVNRLVPLSAATRGELPAGFLLTGPIRADPPAVRVTGPRRRLDAIDMLPLAPVDLAELRGAATITVPVDTTGLGGLRVEPMLVRVSVPVAAAPPDTAAAPDSILAAGS